MFLRPRILFLSMGWVALLIAQQSWANEGVSFVIDTEFPGGNSIVKRIDGDMVYLTPDLRDTEGWWFYWNFRVSGAAGRTLNFQFDGPDPIGVHGPAVSVDGGETWSWLGVDAVKGGTFRYPFPADRGEAQFAMSVPYQESNLYSFLAGYSRNDALAKGKLCTSAKGRDVEMLRAGYLDDEPRHRVMLTARHHACETMASFVLEGILSAVLAEDEDGQWFRTNVEVLAIPFVDKDGVEDGDQGKNRRPRDHNRDYDGSSIHPEPAALRKLAREWPKGKLHVALDLHCPYIRDDHNEEIYIVGSPDEAIWKEQQHFATLLEANNTSPLPYRTSSNLPFGQGWNKSATYSAGKTCSRWAGEIEGVRLAATFEVPYANASGGTVTPESARAFGHSIAKTLRIYLEDL